MAQKWPWWASLRAKSGIRAMDAKFQDLGEISKEIGQDVPEATLDQANLRVCPETFVLCDFEVWYL